MADKDTPTDLAADLEAENAALRAELEQAKADRDRYKPTVDISDFLWESPADVSKWYSDDELFDIEYNRTVLKVNKDRFKRGLPPLPEPDADQRKAMIEEAKRHMFAARQTPPRARPGRVIKMMHSNGRHIVQIPYEPQFNNINGSLADGIVKYQRKGFKQVDPFLCCRRGCMKPASRTADNMFADGGYCGPEHRQEVEGRTFGESKNTMIEVAVG